MHIEDKLFKEMIYEEMGAQGLWSMGLEFLPALKHFLSSGDKLGFVMQVGVGPDKKNMGSWLPGKNSFVFLNLPRLQS